MAPLSRREWGKIWNVNLETIVRAEMQGRIHTINCVCANAGTRARELGNNSPVVEGDVGGERGGGWEVRRGGEHKVSVAMRIRAWIWGIPLWVSVGRRRRGRTGRCERATQASTGPDERGVI